MAMPGRKKSYFLRNSDGSDRSELGRKVSHHRMDVDFLHAMDNSNDVRSSLHQEFDRTNRKLRRISHLQIGICVGTTLLALLVCGGMGLLLAMSISSRKDISLLLKRAEYLEDRLSSLTENVTLSKNEIIENATVMKEPIAMRNFIPSHVWEMVDGQSGSRKQKYARSGERPREPVMSGESFRTHLIAGLNKTVVDLDASNKQILIRLNQSLVQIKYQADGCETRMNRLFNKNSKQLLELSNITSRLVTKLEENEVDSWVDTAAGLISALQGNSSMQMDSNFILLDFIFDQIRNKTLIQFEGILNNETIKVLDKLSDIQKTNQHDNVDIDDALKIIGIDVQKIGDGANMRKKDLKSMYINVYTLAEKLDFLLSKLNDIDIRLGHFNDTVENIRYNTHDADMFIDAKEEHFYSTDVTKNISNFRQLQTLLMEKLENSSQLFEAILRNDSISIIKSIREFRTAMTTNLENNLHTLETTLNDQWMTFSSNFRQNIENLINGRFEKGLQTMQRDESTSHFSQDVNLTQFYIDEQFEKGFKTLKTRLENMCVSLPPADKRPKRIVTRKTWNLIKTQVCTWDQGCTSVLYPTKRCFRVVEGAIDASTWTQARRMCQVMGAYLAEVTDAWEYDVLIKSIPSYGNYWLGGTDRGYEGYWHWDQSGLKMSLNAWAPGQPNNQQYIEHCLHLLHQELTVWNDARCSTKMGYICEAQGPTCDSWAK